MSMNLVVLQGNLTRDPQVKLLPGGSSVCEFGIALNERFGSGEDAKERTTFVECAGFGKTAEFVQKYFQKGSPILLQGRLKYDQWEKDGKKQSKLTVTIDRATFSGGKREGQPAGDDTPF